MTKNGKPSPSIADAMHADIKASGLSYQQVGRGLGLSTGDDPTNRAEQLLYKVVRGERKFPHWLFGQWREVTGGTAFIDAVCRDAGGIFVPMPDCDPGDETALVASINEFAQFAEEASAAHLPDSEGGAATTKEEAQRVEREGMEAIAGILALIALRNKEADRAASPYAASIAEAAGMKG